MERKREKKGVPIRKEMERRGSAVNVCNVESLLVEGQRQAATQRCVSVAFYERWSAEVKVEVNVWSELLTLSG